MTGTGWQRSWVRVLTTALTLAVMVMIFCFSMQNADRSDQTSGRISQAVIPVFYPEYETSQPSVKQMIYNTVQHAVRKCAHFTEYALLGFMLRLCLESWIGRLTEKKHVLLILALLIGALYAGTDELHQLLIDGRSGQWTDVLLDSCGVLTGALIGTLLVRLSEKRRGKNAKE